MTDDPTPSVKYVVNDARFIQQTVDALQQIPVPGPLYESVLKPICAGLATGSCPLPDDLVAPFEAYYNKLKRTNARAALRAGRSRAPKKTAKKKAKSKRR